MPASGRCTEVSLISDSDHRKEMLQKPRAGSGKFLGYVESGSREELFFSI